MQRQTTRGAESSGVMSNDIARSLSAMTISNVKGTDKRKSRRDGMAIDDTVMEFQGSVEGHAGTAVSSTSLELEFDSPVYAAPGLNDSDLEDPQFTHGIHLENGSDVIVGAQVKEWRRDEEQNAVTGAVLEISAVAPGVTELTQFTANLHLTFRGFAAPLEDEQEMS